MKGRFRETRGREVITEGSTRAVIVMRVYRSTGCQVLACYAAETDEGFSFVQASELPRINVDDVGLITYHRGHGDNPGTWDWKKAVIS